MNASVAIQILPNVTAREEKRAAVDAVIAYIHSSGVRYEVGPFETVMEGDYDQLMDIVKNCVQVCVRAGAPSVMGYVKISYDPNGAWSMEDKVGKYRLVEQEEFV